MAESKKTFVFITGFHRSGTSALAKFMASMGVYLGSDLIEAKAGVNDEGFWEHRGIVSINDRILSCLGSSWFDVKPLPGEWWEFDSVRGLFQEAKDLLESEFSSHKLSGAKDPRFCRLLPFWLPLVRELGWQPVAINGYRNILSASQSLRKRDGFPEDFCKLLWLINNVDMELASRQIKSAFIEYDYFLDNPEKMAVNLIGYFKEVPLVAPDSFAGVVNKKLRHHALPDGFSSQDLSPLELLGEEVSDNFRAARQPEIQGRMDHIRRSVYAIVSPSPFLAKLAMDLSSGFVEVNRKMISLGQMHAHAQNIVQERDEQVRILHAELASKKQENNELASVVDHLRSDVAAWKMKSASLELRLDGKEVEASLQPTKNTDGGKKIQDLQVTLEKRTSEMRAALAKIKDMQLEIDSRNDRIASLNSEIASKDQLLSSAEKIIASQAGILGKDGTDAIDASRLADQLKRDIGRLSDRLTESGRRNHALMDRLANAESKAGLEFQALMAERKLTQKLKSDCKFHEEKQLYLDRMLLQLSSEVEDLKRLLEERSRYLQDLESDISGLNVKLYNLHAELSKKDVMIGEIQEKFFFLRTRFLSRLLVKIGVYKVPHE